MTYRQTIDYLYNCLPMFHRIGPAAYKKDLKNTILLDKILGHPHKKFKSIHIAGTNGKGSVSHILAAILQCSGYKTGLYTSPHLKDFRERIRINGKMIPKKFVIDFVQKNKKHFDRINLSFFEWTVGLAFDFFAKQKVDIAVIETGLGGRLDSTNIITPILSIITNISYDHVNLLGDTLEKIAEEKAGIIKKNGVTIVGEKQKEVAHVFINKTKECNARLIFANDFVNVKNSKHIWKNNKSFFYGQSFFKNKKKPSNIVVCELPGIYQKKNIATVLTSVEVLNDISDLKISSASVSKGLANVSSITRIMGRWQVLKKHPLTIADIAHNEAGIREVLEQVKIIKYKNLHIVFGIVNDKDINRILKILPSNAKYYFCQANIPRALPAEKLSAVAKQYSLKGQIIPNVKNALKVALKNASRKDLILVTGSAFVVAEIL
ncbi:MAG: folylpolyglutamate synthase/dihydrofolate synthase family protein [Bacteroidota bacterium]